MLGIEHVAINIGGGQSEVEAAETTLVTTVIPLVGGRVGRNSGNQVYDVTHGQCFAILVTVSKLNCREALVIAPVGQHTGSNVVLGELGVNVTLAAQQIEVVAIKQELDLGGALVDLVIHTIHGLAGLLVDTALVNGGATPTELDTILILIAP